MVEKHPFTSIWFKLAGILCIILILILLIIIWTEPTELLENISLTLIIFIISSFLIGMFRTMPEW